MSTNRLSARNIGIHYSISEKTARLFMLKVHEAMISSKNNPMDDKIPVDKFVLEGKNQEKTRKSYPGMKKKQQYQRN